MLYWLRGLAPFDLKCPTKSEQIAIEILQTISERYIPDTVDRGNSKARPSEILCSPLLYDLEAL